MKSRISQLVHTDTQQSSKRSLLTKLSSLITGSDSTALYAVGVLGLAVVQLFPLTMDVVAFAVTLIPLQETTDSLSNALCQAGAGKIIVAGMWILSALLVYKTIPDIYRGIDQKGKRSGKAQKQAGEYFSAAVTKGIGALVIASMPSILKALGLGILSCSEIDNINIFGYITPAIHVFL